MSASPVEAKPSSSVEIIMSDRPVESMSSDSLVESCTVVFWDVMDYPFPDGLDPDLIYPKMKSILEDIGCRGAVLIKAYVDKDEWLDKKVPDGISIVPIQGDSYARVHCMLVDIALWALEYPATYFEPLGMMVISENIKQDTDFLKALEALEDRYNNLLLALPQHLSSTSLHTVTFECLSTSLLDGVKLVDQSGTLPVVNHKPKSRDETVGFSDGLACLYKPLFYRSDIVVFWDVQGCPTKFSSIGPVLTTKGYSYGDVLINCYVDMDYKIPTEEEEKMDFRRYMIDSIIRVSTEGDRFAKFTRMLLDIVFWAMNNDDIPQNLMLISKHSKDTKCDSVIKTLKRSGFNVIFEPSPEVASISPETIGIFESLCESPPDGVNCGEYFMLQGRLITEKSLALKKEPVVVFWVVEGCPSNPSEIWGKVRSTLWRKGYGHIVSMTAFVVEEKFPPSMIDAYHKAGILVRDIPGEGEREKIAWMLIEFLHWVRWSHRPTNYMLISKPFKDPIFDVALKTPPLDAFNVLFELPDYIFTFGSTLWSAREFCQEAVGQ